MTKNLIGYFFLLITNTCFAESTFLHQKLDRGIEIEIPGDWSVIPKTINNAIETSAEATGDQVGIKDAFATTKNLLAVVAHTPLYAQVRIDSDMPPDLKKSDLLPY